MHETIPPRHSHVRSTVTAHRPQARIMLIGGGIPSDDLTAQAIETMCAADNREDLADPSGIYRRMLSLSPIERGAANMVIVTTGSADAGYGPSIRERLLMLGVSPEHCQIVNAKQREEADSEAVAAQFAAADIVFLAGGQQDIYADTFRNTQSYEVLKRRMAHDPHFVLAGTSAGAMVQSSPMINGGKVGSVVENMLPGFGFLPLLIDTHVDARQRDGRTITAKRALPGTPAVGLDERTALILTPSQAEVYGSGTVKIMADQPFAALDVHMVTKDMLTGAQEANADGLHLYRLPHGVTFHPAILLGPTHGMNRAAAWASSPRL